MDPEDAAKARKEARKKVAPVEVIECPICMEESDKWVGLACNHRTCFGCAKKWQSTGNYTCPMCRTPSKVLCWLKTVCPRRSADGVSIVAARRARKRANRLQYFYCHGCGERILYEYGALHRACKTRTCDDCCGIARDRGWVPCATCLSVGLFGEQEDGKPIVIVGGIFGPDAVAATLMAVVPMAEFPGFVDLTQPTSNEFDLTADDPPGPSSGHGGIESPERSTSASLIPT